MTSHGASQVVLVVKNFSANAKHIRGAGSIPGSGRSPGGGQGNPFQYSCPENPMDRGESHGQRRIPWTEESMGSQRVGHVS